jgi:pimeloyl-ACP methyl ester carboxylesterase
MVAVTSERDRIETYRWTWQGREIEINYRVKGEGQPMLFLPALSTVSCRTEMYPLADLFAAANFQTITIDLPGFGDRSRPELDYSPPLYRQFIADFIRDVCPQPLRLIAAGHAAGYAIQYNQEFPANVLQLILLAPTWRGPLPTMMGGYKPWLSKLKELIYLPVIGQFLYKLNSTDGFLKFMYGRHVYHDRTKLTTNFIASKRQITRNRGARYGAAAFVTGGLDPYPSRESAIADLASITNRVLLVIGTDSPPKSLAEMQAMSELPNVDSYSISGTLGLHEEYAQELFDRLKDLT